MGVAFFIALVKQFTLRNVLVNFPINLRGAWFDWYELGWNGFLDGCQEGFRLFPPEDVNIVGSRGPQKTFSQLNVSLLVISRQFS